LTAREALERWPAGVNRPRLRAVSGRLRALADEGRLRRAGRGTRYEPYRYQSTEVAMDSLSREGPKSSYDPGSPSPFTDRK
jgi:hypothetical protein